MLMQNCSYIYSVSKYIIGLDLRLIVFEKMKFWGDCKKSSRFFSSPIKKILMQNCSYIHSASKYIIGLDLRLIVFEKMKFWGDCKKVVDLFFITDLKKI